MIKFLNNKNNSILSNDKMNPLAFSLCTQQKTIALSNQLIDVVRNSVIEVTEIPWGYIMVLTRKGEVVQARQMTHYFLRKYTKLSLSVIGKIAGNKDHATVMHSIKVVNNLMSTEKAYKEIIDTIDSAIKKNIDNIGNTFLFSATSDTIADWENVKNKYL